MENASKALLIAGAILVCILLIAIGMYVYNSTQGTVRTAAGQMSQQDKEMYNSMIKKYIGDSKKGAEIKTMIEEIIGQNNQYVGESGKFISIHTGPKPGSLITGTYGIDGYTGSSMDNLAEIGKKANVYEDNNGENTQSNIDEATAAYRRLKQKIIAGRNYIVEGEESDGIIYSIYINQVRDGNTPVAHPL